MKKRTVQPGDIYAVMQPNQMYAVVGVLQKTGKTSLIFTSEYLAPTVPSIDDPSLLKVLRQHRFFFQNEKAITRVDGMPPDNFLFLGQVPSTVAEQAVEMNSYSGKWTESTGNESYMEWRWLHDRQAFEEDVRIDAEERDRLRRVPQKPKRMMDEHSFWAIIQILDWTRQGDDEKVLAPAVLALAGKSKIDICRFAERLAFLLYQMDTKAHARTIGDDSYDEKEGFVSADGFLYVRCAAVANGRAFYETALADPAKMPKGVEFESLLYLAPAAYEKKTGKDFEYVTGCSFESFSNPTGWK